MKIIFLDIDGVLNGHEWCHVPRSRKINASCVRVLQTVIDKTGARIVLASSWSHMITSGSLTCLGMQLLLASHGLDCQLIDALPVDRVVESRRKLVADYVAANQVARYAHIDDLDIGGPNHVRPHPARGLEPFHASQLIALL